jgi:formylglycine-generating enzyme required for sulfatase activity
MENALKSAESDSLQRALMVRLFTDIYFPSALTADAERALKPGNHFPCPEMVVIPAGSFQMGSANEEGRDDDEGPQHSVTITSPFAVGRLEVTFDEWDACTAHRGCPYQPLDQGWGRSTRPVINEDAQRYVAWLSKQTGQSYRLLTEAE